MNELTHWPIDGNNIIIPTKQLNLWAPNRRKDKFLAVYPDLLKLKAQEVHTFLVLLHLAEYDNKVKCPLKEVYKAFSPLTTQAVDARLKRIKVEGAVGRIPQLFLNPFFGSKCGTSLLKDLRKQWILRKETE